MEGFHVRQQRLSWYYSIAGTADVNEFVVTDRCRSPLDSTIAGPGSIDQSGVPEHRIGTELQRVEGVINAPMGGIDLALPLGGAHMPSCRQNRSRPSFDTHRRASNECSKYAEL